MARVVDELNQRENRSKLTVEYVESKYKDYVEIDEYDGLETLNININLYLLDGIAKLLENDEINDEECLLCINELVEQREKMD